MADHERPAAAGEDAGQPGRELAGQRAFATRAGSVPTDETSQAEARPDAAAPGDLASR